MASPLITRAPCLGCLRRITQADTTPITLFLRQVRGKKTSGRLKDAGVIVRLLKDMRGFGKAGAIFRTERGRMRNLWYPTKTAEFVTDARLKELGLKKKDIGERDPMFGMQIELEDEVVEDAVEAVSGYSSATKPPVAGSGAGAGRPGLENSSAPSAPAVEVDYIAPNRALELLQTMIPETLVFERHLKHLPPSSVPGTSGAGLSHEPDEPAQPKALSPLERRRAKMLEAQKPSGPEKTPEEAEAERKAKEEELERERKRAEHEAEKFKEIHGSVSLRDIAVFIKEKLILDLEASRIHVQPEEIKFLGLPAGVDKVEKVGKFEIEIQTHVGKDRVEPVRKSVEVAAA